MAKLAEKSYKKRCCVCNHLLAQCCQMVPLWARHKPPTSFQNTANESVLCHCSSLPHVTDCGVTRHAAGYSPTRGGTVP